MDGHSDVDDTPFVLNLKTLQGRWMCEEFGQFLTVKGRCVRYASGECYPIDLDEKKKLFVCGFRASESKSDASTIKWYNKATGESLTWLFEEADDDDLSDSEKRKKSKGEAEGVDDNVESDSRPGKRLRERKPVDYAALDRIMGHEGSDSSKQAMYAAMKNDIKRSRDGGASVKHERLDSQQRTSWNGSQEKTSWNGSQEKTSWNGFQEKTSSSESSSLSVDTLIRSVEAEIIKRVSSLRSSSDSASLGSEKSEDPHTSKFEIKGDLNSTQFAAVTGSAERLGDILFAEISVRQKEGRVKISVNLTDKHETWTSVVSAAIASLSEKVEGDSEKTVSDSNNLLSKSLLALTRLEYVPMTVKLLSETKCGLALNNWAKDHNNERAKRLVDKWKQIYMSEKK